jgi:hypothetical protein
LYQRIIDTPPNQALYCENRIFRIGDRLPPSNLTDQALATFGECDN